MSKKYVFKVNLDGINDEIDKIIDGTLSEPPFKGEGQKQRIYELVCEYINKNIDLKLDSMLKDEEINGKQFRGDVNE